MNFQTLLNRHNQDIPFLLKYYKRSIKTENLHGKTCIHAHIDKDEHNILLIFSDTTIFTIHNIQNGPELPHAAGSIFYGQRQENLLFSPLTDFSAEIYGDAAIYILKTEKKEIVVKYDLDFSFYTRKDISTRIYLPKKPLSGHSTINLLKEAKEYSNVRF